MLELVIRNAYLDDIDRILEIKRLCWKSVHLDTERGITEEYVDEITKKTEKKVVRITDKFNNRDGSSRYFLAEIDGIVRGYSLAEIDKFGRAWVGGIFVEPDFAGKGIGKKLLSEVIQFHKHHKDVYLKVVTYNQNAINMYLKHGFKFVEGGSEDMDLGPQFKIPLQLMIREET